MGLQAGAGFFRPLQREDPARRGRVLLAIGGALVFHVLVLGGALFTLEDDEVLPEVRLRLLDGQNLVRDVPPEQPTPVVQSTPSTDRELTPSSTEQRSADSDIRRTGVPEFGDPDFPRSASDASREPESAGFLDELLRTQSSSVSSDAPSRAELEAAAQAEVVQSSSSAAEASSSPSQESTSALAERIDQARATSTPGSSTEQAEASPAASADGTVTGSVGSADFSGRRLLDADAFVGLENLQLRDPGLGVETIAIRFRIDPNGYAELLPGVLPTGIPSLDQVLSGLFGRVLFVPTQDTGAVTGILTLSVDG